MRRRYTTDKSAEIRTLTPFGRCSSDLSVEHRKPIGRISQAYRPRICKPVDERSTQKLDLWAVK
ncbi:hypothetical protein BJ741DRAFT_703513 [Chytriomyces cf. hyalinus JEL632]|nr:hypothetical protein BJ741DRAFT_703513 [Chytriomyces cf. hyalinus JEL632]